MQNSDKVHPLWMDLPVDGWSLRALYLYFESGNPLGSFSSRAFPFIVWTSAWFRLLHPSCWVAVGMLLLLIGMFFRRTNQDESPVRAYRGWITLALILALAWLVGPSSFGTAHGEGLRSRLFLLALIAIIPALRLDSKYLHVWAGAAALVMVVGVRSAIVWDCALTSNRLVSLFMEAQSSIGTGRRIGTLRLAKPSRCPSDALYHADTILGMGTGNIIWNNYESAQYYFPVKYRDERGLSLVQKFNTPVNVNVPDAHELIDQWARLLTKHHSAIDTFVMWGTDPGLNAMILQWYGPEPVFQRGDLRVFQHR